MLENLSELVRENVQESVVNNSAVPNEQNEAVIQAASGSIFDALKNQLSSGNIGGLAEIFNTGNTEGSPVTAQAAGNFTDKLAGLGINAETAKNLASTVIPVILSKLTKKTADPNDNAFNIQDVLGNLAGGADGKFDVSDVIGMFNGGNQAQGGNTSESGGIMDKLKGLFN
ncbi:hypothetical protein [Pedobacter aquatilis]|uniref:hypothetical protein n=1 Tax=Pedobacter aquatilis TaxID=351343 RepID=UPI0029313F5E|nr:hypothetical protein [Pedobacter aquatilis]